MVRTILTPVKKTIQLDIPESFVGKKIEIIAFEIDEANEKPAILEKGIMEQFWGFMSNETTADLQKKIIQSRREWDNNI